MSGNSPLEEMILRFAAEIDKQSFDRIEKEIQGHVKRAAKSVQKDGTNLDKVSESIPNKQLEQFLSTLRAEGLGGKDIDAAKNKFIELQQLAFPPEMLKDILGNFDKLREQGIVKTIGAQRALNLAVKQTESGAKWAGRIGANSFRLMRTTIQAATVTLMVLGRVLTQIFQQAWRQGVKVFNDVMHSVDGVTTGFDVLQGVVYYLGFVIGQALEPVTEYLIPIVQKIADWVAENPKLARTLLLIVGVVGVLATVLGFLGFIGQGIYFFFSVMFPSLGLKALGFGAAIKSVAAWFITFSKVSIFSLLMAKVKAFSLIAALAKLKLGVIAVGKAFAAVLLKFLVIGAFIALVLYLGTIWRQVWEAMKIRFEQFINFFKDGWEGIKYVNSVLTNAIKLAWLTLKKLLYGIIEGIVNFFVDKFNSIIDIINKIIRAGKEVGVIGKGVSEITPLVRFSFDSSSVDAEISEIVKQLEKDAIARDMYLNDRDKRNADLTQKLKANLEDAGKALGESSIFGRFMKAQETSVDYDIKLLEEAEESNDTLMSLLEAYRVSMDNPGSLGDKAVDEHIEINNATFEIYVNKTDDIMRELEREMRKYGA